MSNKSQPANEYIELKKISQENKFTVKIQKLLQITKWPLNIKIYIKLNNIIKNPKKERNIYYIKQYNWNLQ